MSAPVECKASLGVLAYYGASFAGIAALLYGIDWDSVPLLAAGSALLAAWAAVSVAIVRRWWRASVAEGGYACWIWQWRSCRVHHLHWPRAGIVNCRNSAGFSAGRRAGK